MVVQGSSFLIANGLVKSIWVLGFRRDQEEFCSTGFAMSKAHRQSGKSPRQAWRAAGGAA